MLLMKATRQSMMLKIRIGQEFFWASLPCIDLVFAVFCFHVFKYFAGLRGFRRRNNEPNRRN